MSICVGSYSLLLRLSNVVLNHHGLVNNNTIYRRGSWSTLVDVTACRLFGAKSLPELIPILIY